MCCNLARPFATPQERQIRANRTEYLFSVNTHSPPTMTVDSGEEFTVEVCGAFDDVEVHLAAYISSHDAHWRRSFPELARLQRQAVELAGTRTLLMVPLCKDGRCLGYSAGYRTEVRAFTDKQIAAAEFRGSGGHRDGERPAAR